MEDAGLQRSGRSARERPIFVFGCPRSGTSLLSRILNNHPRIGIPFESHIFHYMYRWAPRYGDLSEEDRVEALVADLLTMEDVKEWNPPATLRGTMNALRRHDFHGVFDAMLTSWAAAQGKSRWGEKTPQHALQWREILPGFPDAQVLYLIRDGRDVGLSYKRAFFGPKHMYAIARRWVHFLRVGEEIRQALGANGLLPVRYEDLITNPETVVRTICEFLGEGFDAAMLQPQRSDVPYPTDRRNLENLQRPILAGNAGRWKSEMSARDLRIFEGVAGGDLERYGYARALGPVRLSAGEIFRYRYLEHPPVKAIAMLGNTKTQRIMWQMLRIYLRRRLGIWKMVSEPAAARE